MISDRDALTQIAWVLYNKNIPSYDTWEEIAGILAARDVENPWKEEEV